jgi:hydroxyacylglutathione hydrolase
MINVQTFTFSPIQENTYVLFNENNDAIIIDPGCYSNAERDTLKSFLAAKHLKPVYLLNTHCHLDHVFGNKWVAETYSLIPHIHPNEQKMLQMAPASGELWGMPFDNYEGPLTFINDNETIAFGNDELKIILAPGHSPGSVCFYAEEYNFIIGGDVLFRESIGRTDLPFGNHSHLIDSIQSRIFVLPDETVVYSGHGPTTTVGYEKEHNPFL